MYNHALLPNTIISGLYMADIFVVVELLEKFKTFFKNIFIKLYCHQYFYIFLYYGVPIIFQVFGLVLGLGPRGAYH